MLNIPRKHSPGDGSCPWPPVPCGDTASRHAHGRSPLRAARRALTSCGGRAALAPPQVRPCGQDGKRYPAGLFPRTGERRAGCSFVPGGACVPAGGTGREAGREAGGVLAVPARSVPPGRGTDALLLWSAVVRGAPRAVPSPAVLCGRRPERACPELFGAAVVAGGAAGF